MKKNLIYYCLGIDPTYFEIFKVSLNSLDKSNPDLYDVLIITDESYYNLHLKDFQRDKLFFHIVPEFKNKDEIVFSKLKIFEWEKIYDYENVFLTDSDVIINYNLSRLFEGCLEKNKIYAPIEDYSFDNHKRIYFSLGNYTESDIEFFKINNIHTFNTGTILFKVSVEMKLHFQNIRRIISGHKGDFFTEQSFFNFYFNKMNIVDYELLKWNENLIYIVQSNFYTQKYPENKIFHLIGNTFDGKTKEKKIKEFYELFSKRRENVEEKLINLLSVTPDRKQLFFETKNTINCHVNVWDERKLVLAERMNLVPNIHYWVALDDGYKNKTIEFINEYYYQKDIIFGREETLKKKIQNYKLTCKFSPLSLICKEKNEKEFKSRRDYLDYYYEIFRHSKYRKNKILEFGIDQNSSLIEWNRIFPNSKIISTTTDLEYFKSVNNKNLYICDEGDLLSTEQFFNNKDVCSLFDLVICKDINKIKNEIQLRFLLSKIDLGASLVVENISIDDIENYLNLIEPVLVEDKNYSVTILALSEEFDTKTKLILLIRRENIYCEN